MEEVIQIREVVVAGEQRCWRGEGGVVGREADVVAGGESEEGGGLERACYEIFRKWPLLSSIPLPSM